MGRHDGLPKLKPFRFKSFGFHIQTSRSWHNIGGTQLRSSREPRCTASSKSSNTLSSKCGSGTKKSLEIFFKKENSWNKNLKPFKRWPFKLDHPKSAVGGAANQTTIGREIKSGRNSLETKIQNSMAKRRGKKHKILPPLDDPQALHQSHNQARKCSGKHPAHSSGHHSGAH
jgi:hypothetical protein